MVDAPTITRNTRQRRAIAAILNDLDNFASAQRIHDELRHRGESVGLSTVYRALQAMADSQSIDAVRNDEGETLYRACSSGHHHHLVCRECGRAIEVDGPAVERWADALAERHGFVNVEHTVEIFGTCADCAT